MELVAGITFLLLLLSTADADFRNSPSVTSLHENYEASIDIWTIDASCTVRYCSASIYFVCTEYTYDTHTCNSCWLSSNPGHFSIDSFTVKKIQCTDTKCGPTCSANGCLNGGETYYYTVTCEYTLGSYETTGQFSWGYSLSATNANPPTFTYTAGSSIDVYKTTADIGTNINTIVATVQDVGEPNDVDTITYVQNSGPGASFIHATTDLFYLDTETGEVKVGKSLDTEFSYYFTMNLCVKDRRHRQVCHDLNITLHACFQTPNCTHLTENNLHDTFSTYTGHDVGSDNVVFEMDYPQPGQHFVDFSTSWHDLTWTFDSNEFPEAAIDSNTGNIYITRNISIWPAWPTKHYSQRVRVSNSESCYTTTCDMSITVHYTNWPISIESLPATTSLHEDTDSLQIIHNLTTYDYNPDPEDNVTCVLVSVAPNEDNLFELVHNGDNTWNSYSIHKLACATPDCGYKPANFLCDVGIGCMNHNLTQQYIITIKCDDGYNSSDTQSLTFNVNKNIAPTYTNVPNHLDLDRNVISHLDIVFSILYSDPENERLYYEYTYEDTSTSVDPGYFLGSTSGNYYNDMGNITMTVFLHDKEVNTTYRIHICGHERRNEICDDITIDIEEYCSEAPACTGGVISVTTEFTVGDEVFDISSLVTGPTSGGSYTSLSYAISGIQANYFDIDTSTGSVTTAKPLVTNFPTSTEKTYLLTGFVYDYGACGYGTCLLTVYVSAINYPVQIDNLPTTVSIHEDTLNIQTLYTLQISDDNSNDSYTCSILNTMDVEPFYLDQVPAGSRNYEFRNRQDYVLTTATLTYTATIFCEDIYGSNHTGEITIEVIENQPPFLTNLANPTTQNMNPLDYKLGDIVYVVRASDTENDDLIYSCQVATNYVPFECYQESSWNYAYIILRRNLHIYNDDGQTESIDVCVSDPKHYNASCGTLQVTFTLALTPPEITNLPTTEYVPEDTASGYTIFTPVITDPDAGETHIVTVNVYPSSHSNKFRIDVTTGVLTLNGFLNYENVDYYEFVYRIRDNYLDGLTEKILAVNITNVNEGNTITADITSVSFYENMTENTKFEDLGITCTDIDGDDVSISITPGTDSDHFGLNPITNRLSLTQSWDYETEAPSATLTITCTDGTLDSSVIILVAALDVNDNKPTLVTTFGDVNTAIMINPNTPLSTIHVSVSATDVDAGNNGDFDFSIAGRGVGYKYFRMVPKSSRRKRSTGFSEADLKLKKFADFTNHKSFPLTILACDTFGGIEQCGGLTFTVNFTASNPDNKTQEETKCLTCTSTGRTYITILIIEGVIIVILILHFCYSIFCRRHEVVKLSDFDKTRNTRFNAKFNPAVTLNFKTPTVPMSRRSPVKPTHVIPIGKPQPSKRTQKHEDISTSESSSSSSDDDDRITEMTLRDRVERVRFNRGPPSTPASVGLPPPLPAPSFTGLPPAVYSSNVI